MNGHVVYGQALFDAGRYPESQATFETALGLDPENLIALRHLGDIARIGNDAQQAIAWYTRVLEADPRNDEIVGFINELNAAMPAVPAAVPATAEPTPVSAPVAPVPTAIAGTSSATVVAEVAPSDYPAELPTGSGRGSPAPGAAQDPTPIIPIESVPPRRASIPLMDMDLDTGDVGGFGDVPASSEPSFGALAPTGAHPEDAAAPDGIEFTAFGSVDVGTEPDVLSLAEPEPETPLISPEPAFDHGMESGLLSLDGGVDLGPAEQSEAPPATPDVFVTETMAELYLQQGFREEALGVYRQLAAQNPDDESLRERVAMLESGGRASLSLERVSDEIPIVAAGTESVVPMNEPAAPEIDALFDAEQPLDLAPAPEPTATEPTAPEPTATEPSAPEPPAPEPTTITARSFFAGLAQRSAVRSNGSAANVLPANTSASVADAAEQGRGSLDALFGGGPVAEGDDAMGRALATAVGEGEPATIRGRPTEPAGSEFSLDSVFRGDGVMRASGPVVRQSTHLKFDQFFAADDAPAPPQPAEPDGAAPPADDAQFQNWLQGLKGK